jgi:hypothetical protein
MTRNPSRGGSLPSETSRSQRPSPGRTRPHPPNPAAAPAETPAAARACARTRCSAPASPQREDHAADAHPPPIAARRPQRPAARRTPHPALKRRAYPDPQHRPHPSSSHRYDQHRRKPEGPFDLATDGGPLHVHELTQSRRSSRPMPPRPDTHPQRRRRPPKRLPADAGPQRRKTGPQVPNTGDAQHLLGSPARPSTTPREHRSSRRRLIKQLERLGHQVTLEPLPEAASPRSLYSTTAEVIFDSAFCPARGQSASPGASRLPDHSPACASLLHAAPWRLGSCYGRTEADEPSDS